MAKLKDLKVTIGLEKKGLRRLNQQLKETKYRFRANFGEIASMAKNLAMSIGTTLVGAVSAMIAASAKMETVKVSFRSIMGGADGAARMVAKLNKFAANTPFQLEDISTAARQLLAVGTKESAIESTLKTLGDLAAANGASITEMSAIYAKAQAKGKIDQEILNQLLDRGINIQSELIKVTGQTGDEFKATSVSVEDFNQAIRNMADEGGIAQDAMLNLSHTTSGLLSTLQDVSMQFAAQAADQSGISGYFQGQLRLAIGAFNRAIDTTAADVDNLKQEFTDLMAQALEPTTENIDDVESGLGNLQKSLKAALDKTSEGTDEYRRLNSMLNEVVATTIRLNKAVLGGTLPAGAPAAPAVPVAAAKEEKKVKEELIQVEKSRLQTMGKIDELQSKSAVDILAAAYAQHELKGAVEQVQAVTTSGGWMQEMKATLEAMVVSSMQLATTIGNQLGNALYDIVRGTKSAGEAFKRFAAEAIKAALAASQANIIAAAVSSGMMTGPKAMIVIPALITAGMAIVDTAFGQIPQMAEGGLFAGMSLAMVGEGPGTSMINPEVVAPLDKLQQMMGGGNVTVTGMIRGQDILISNERSLLDRNRVRGF